jgi:PIN domain nuclease of toxin-antitoxin system
MNEFFDSTNKYEIKIFQIDKTFYEFRDLHSTQDIILHIVDEHRRSIEEIDSIGTPLPSRNHDGITYFTYVYNEEEKDSYWASFLPSDLIAQHSFTVQQLSLVLFAEIGNNIFVLVGGTGIRVILRYINHRFGLELYEFMANPSEDIINFITTRGISGNLSENKRTFRDGQKLSDSLNFTNIPTKINLVLREELKNTVFDFIEFTSEKVYLEVASYFCIKIRVSFEDLHNTFISINNVLNSDFNLPLTSFVHVKDKNITEISYRMELYFRIKKDMFDRLIPTSAVRAPRFDIDFVHPSKLQEFYECDSYEMFERNAKKPFFKTNNRNRLYFEGLKWLFDNSGFDFNYVLSGIRVIGYKGTQKKTNAMFTQHITCEINVNHRPIFLIDTNWYKVNNDFIETINRTCVEMLTKNYLRDNILTIPWDSSLTEGAYNLLYEPLPNFRIFDKVLSQNIELCDLFYEDDNSIYLIHVKDGFDAKIRDVSNQIIISATRYWNDKNSGSYGFLDGIINKYNSLAINASRQIVRDEFIKKFSEKDVYFVMAFNSTLKNHKDIRNDIVLLHSNIAKYSLIQCVRDMNTEMYQIKLFDIASL